MYGYCLRCVMTVELKIENKKKSKREWDFYQTDMRPNPDRILCKTGHFIYFTSDSVSSFIVCWYYYFSWWSIGLKEPRSGHKCCSMTWT